MFTCYQQYLSRNNKNFNGLNKKSILGMDFNVLLKIITLTIKIIIINNFN